MPKLLTVRESPGTSRLREVFGLQTVQLNIAGVIDLGSLGLLDPTTTEEALSRFLQSHGLYKKDTFQGIAWPPKQYLPPPAP